jgi:hypothetical protein
MKKVSRSSCFYFILFICSTGLLAQNDQTIAFGPYLQNMTSNSVTVCWSTPDGESVIANTEGKTDTIRRYQQHYIKLPRLEAKSTYRYDILGNGAAAGIGSFTTFPGDIEPFHFVTLGDTRSRHDVHQKIVGGIIKEKPLFVVNTGDLVSNGDNIKDWEQFFTINQPLMSNIPYFPVLGNHENDSQFYYDFFDLPGNERYYNFSVGDALFLVLDSEGPKFQTPVYIKKEDREAFWENYNLDYFKQQKAWVKNILDLNRDAGYIFVFMHKPLYSIKKSRLEGAKLRREFWGNIFEINHVQVVFSGHDHHYHHAVHGGTHYITTAGGGAGLYETDAPQPETVKFSKIEHFMLINVGLESTHLTAIDISGQVIDEITVDKRK